MSHRLISWEEAEALFPDCSAEWDLLVRDGRSPDWATRQFKPFDSETAFSSTEVAELRLVTWSHPAVPGKDEVFLEVLTADPWNHWYRARSWRRWRDGSWTAPMAEPKFFLSQFYDISYVYAPADRSGVMTEPVPQRLKAHWSPAEGQTPLEAYDTEAVREMADRTVEAYHRAEDRQIAEMFQEGMLSRSYVLKRFGINLAAGDTLTITGSIVTTGD